MKFGDVIVAVATVSVIVILLESVLLLVFVPAMSHSGIDVAGILSTLVGSLIVGYLFALKIQEESRSSRLRASLFCLRLLRHSALWQLEPTLWQALHLRMLRIAYFLRVGGQTMTGSTQFSC